MLIVADLGGPVGSEAFAGNVIDFKVNTVAKWLSRGDSKKQSNSNNKCLHLK